MLCCYTVICKSSNALLGRYDLNDEVLFCDVCKKEEYLPGFWPGSVERHSQYLFNEDLFLLFDFIQKFNPGLSTSGFLHALEQFSAVKNRVSIYVCMYIGIHISKNIFPVFIWLDFVVDNIRHWKCIVGREG